MRKTSLLSAALLLATSGIALSLYAQGAQSANPSTTQSTTVQTSTTKSDDNQAPAQSTTTQTTTSAVNTAPTVDTFTGKITKKDKQFLLEDKDKNASYKLDDARKADRFEGKVVRVIGTLDAATNMIHVQSIEEEKNKS